MNNNLLLIKALAKKMKKRIKVDNAIWSRYINNALVLRPREDVSYTDTLNAAAREYGYDSWEHALICNT